jgi:hypothetical protein
MHVCEFVHTYPVGVHMMDGVLGRGGIAIHDRLGSIVRACVHASVKRGLEEN